MIKTQFLGNSLAVQWLGLCVSTAGGPGSIPGQGAKIPYAAQHWPKQTNKQKNPTKQTKKPPVSQDNIY